MKAIKVALGSLCLVMALLLITVVIVDFQFRADWSLTLASCCLAGFGSFLVARRNRPISKNGLIVSLLSSGLFVVILSVGIPAFIKAHATRCCNGCINNLRQIDGAINEWAVEQGRTNGSDITESNIKPYLKLDALGNIPKCPDGGVYALGRVGDRYQVTCSLSTNTEEPHILP